MRWIKPLVLSSCLLPSLWVSADTDNAPPPQRYCKVVNGIIECKSLRGDRAIEQGRALYQQTARQHGPLLGYGSPGYRDSQSRFTAIITDAEGRQSRRVVRLKYLETAPGNNRRLLIFEQPADLKRHALLTISHARRADEHWAYDPDTQQVKRLLSNNASTPFSGSEFNFEDLSSQDLAKYDYRFEREDLFDGQKCVVVNRFPRDKGSGYARLETWIDSQTYLIRKIDYFDRRGQLYKTLTASDYQLYDDKYWRANRISIRNHQTANSTLLLWSDYRFNTGLAARDFTLASLKNVN